MVAQTNPTAMIRREVNLSIQLTWARSLRRSERRFLSTCLLFHHLTLVETSLYKIRAPVMHQKPAGLRCPQAPHAITSKSHGSRLYRLVARSSSKPFRCSTATNRTMQPTHRNSVASSEVFRRHPAPRGIGENKITSLCVKDLLVREAAPRPDISDRRFVGIFDRKFRICAFIEGRKLTSLDSQISLADWDLAGWENLRKICLCMRAGEERFYIQFLF